MKTSEQVATEAMEAFTFVAPASDDDNDVEERDWYFIRDQIEAAIERDRDQCRAPAGLPPRPQWDEGRGTIELGPLDGLLDDVLLNWGIEVQDYSDPDWHLQVSAQIGPGEAVEYEELYSLMRDIAYAAMREGERTGPGVTPPARQEVGNTVLVGAQRLATTQVGDIEVELWSAGGIIEAVVTQDGEKLISERLNLVSTLEGWASALVERAQKGSE